MDAATFAETFRLRLSAMDPVERAKAVEAVRAAIDAELADEVVRSAASRPLCCPECGSVSHVRRGRGRNGAQRYRCRDCGRSFQAPRGGVLGATKLDGGTWAAYAECFVLCLSLRECARRCGVCLKTAWTMRHRLIACLAARIPAFSVAAGGGCELDETYFRESFKGNHSKGSFEMPRPARHRGGGLSKRGLSKEQICVVSGIDDAGTPFLEACGRGPLTTERARRALAGRVGPGAAVATDRAHAYAPALAALGVSGHRAYDPKDRAHGTINRVNSLHSRLKAFMGRFKGVSTKHLQGYLDWFMWLSAYRGAGRPAVLHQAAVGPRPGRMREMFNVEPPFMSYWAA